jgi:DNA-binding transcriptional ArsR family regulator
MRPDIREHILREIARDGRGVNARVAETFGITRQAASGHLTRLKSAGLVGSEGQGRGVRYSLLPLRQEAQGYAREGLSEDVVWRALCAPIVSDLAKNVRDIWRYGITEMVNNAVDHSDGGRIEIAMARNAVYTAAQVVDDGVGIFNKVQRALDLYDPREALLELAKGKFTTEPARHTGEGIFFSSKLFDVYDIVSGDLHFMHDADRLDILMERPKNAPGTLVFMRLDNASDRVQREIFNEFAGPEDHTFAKTIVPVRLAQYEGEKLVSRSQAKRLTLRFERFQQVVLDFEGVEEIGPAFADEVFRVFETQHPHTTLVPIHTTPLVEAMVRRARASR